MSIGLRGRGEGEEEEGDCDEEKYKYCVESEWCFIHHLMVACVVTTVQRKLHASVFFLYLILFILWRSSSTRSCMCMAIPWVLIELAIFVVIFPVVTWLLQ